MHNTMGPLKGIERERERKKLTPIFWSDGNFFLTTFILFLVLYGNAQENRCSRQSTRLIRVVRRIWIFFQNVLLRFSFLFWKRKIVWFCVFHFGRSKCSKCIEAVRFTELNDRRWKRRTDFIFILLLFILFLKWTTYGWKSEGDLSASKWASAPSLSLNNFRFN